MKLLLKDHKPLGADGLPPTRPVVGASKAINVALRNIINDIIESLGKSMHYSGEVISSEHLLNNINNLNNKWKNTDEELPQPQPGQSHISLLKYFSFKGDFSRLKHFFRAN